MSGLSALKFIASKRQHGTSPAHARRQKLSAKLHEQIQMAKVVQSGTEFVPVKVRTVRDDATGEMRRVEIPKRLKPWWWPGENGKLCITVRYGARTLDVIEGKNAIETDTIAGVITTLGSAAGQGADRQRTRCHLFQTQAKRGRQVRNRVADA